MKKSLFVGLFFAATIISCKKTEIPDDNNLKPPTGNNVYQQTLSDSLYLYAQQIYLWNASLPTYTAFNPRQYAKTDTLAGLRAELLALTRFAKNPENNKPFEQAITYDDSGNPQDDNSEPKYSFIEKTVDSYNGGVTSFGKSAGRFSNVKMTLDGKENEMGFILGFIPVSLSASVKEKLPFSNPDSSVAYVRAVTNGSPAYNAGLRRGQIVSKFNGQKWSIDNNRSQIISALNANSITLTLYKPSKDSSWDLNITKGLYTFNPVYKDTVLSINGKNIGYIAFKSFTDLNTNAKAALNQSFSKFNNLSDIVIDLRYNGGGYVETSEYFCNLLAPSSATNKILFVEYYNQTMQNKQAKLLEKQIIYDVNNNPKSQNYFNVDYSISGNTTVVRKEGSFNSNNSITNLYFIVSSATASASELLINSLRPHFASTFIIGAAFSDNGTKTYGKPVGFFEIRLGMYSVYMSNFESKNAAQIAETQAGNYYSGITTNLQKLDDIRFDFGDPNELCFLYAIRRITGDNNYIPTKSLKGNISTSDVSPTAKYPLGRGIGAVTKVQDMFKKVN